MDSAAFSPADVLAVAVSLAFVIAVLEAGISDVCSFQIPNHVPVILLVSFIPIAVLKGFSLQDWLNHVGVFLFLFGISLALFTAKVWGGGDAKLVPAIGLWIGTHGLTRFLLVMSVAGCGLSVAALLAKLISPEAVGRMPPWQARLVQTRQVPYGLAIAGAALDWWIRVVLS